jgi:adenylate cyclase
VIHAKRYAVTSPRIERRLAAILAADVAGYSRLMGADEVGTLTALKVHRRERIDPAIDQHNGRIVKTTGDGTLVEFASVVDAVICAVAIQRAMLASNAGIPENRQIELRIGINVGDIIIDGGDIFGDGVNVAARLEALCEPGGVCISRSANEQVRDKLSLAFADLGEQTVKNIARAVGVFGLAAKDIAALSEDALPQPEPILLTRRGRAGVMAAGPPVFDGQPAIAVLPFRSYASGDDPFADGLTDELINALSGWRSFPVIARNSIFAYRGRDIDVRVIGRELGARYVVSGSVRRQGGQVRVTLELVDVETAGNLLSERYDHISTDPLSLQVEIVRKIAGVLAPEVLKLERERAVRRPPTDATVYDLFERGMWHRYRNTRQDLESAEALFRAALDIDHHYARATAALSLCRNFAAISRWTPDVPAAHAESLVLARRAVADDPRDPHAHFALGVACMNASRLQEAIAELSETVRLNPSHAFAYANLGQVFNYLNRPDEGLAQVELALRLNPHDPRRFMWLPYLAASYYLSRRYKACLDASEQALSTNPGYPHAVRYMVAALGQLGRVAEARPLISLLRRADRDFAGLEALTRSLFVPEAADHLLDGFRRAGFN